MGRLTDLLETEETFKSSEDLGKKKEKKSIPGSFKSTSQEILREVTPKTGGKLTQALNSIDTQKPDVQIPGPFDSFEALSYVPNPKPVPKLPGPFENFETLRKTPEDLRYDYVDRQVAEADAKKEQKKLDKIKRKESRDSMDVIQEELRQVQMKKNKTSEDFATIEKLKTDFANAQVVGNPTGRGIIEGLPFGSKLTGSLDKLTDTNQQLIDEARQTPQYKGGSIATKLGTQVALYSTVGAALRGTQFVKGLATKLGAGKVAQFTAGQIADLFVDAAIQTPQEVLRGETIEKIGMNRLLDIGINLGIGAGGEFIKSLKSADPIAFEGAVKNLSPEDAKVIRDTLQPDSVPLRQATQDIQAVKGADILNQPQLGPIRQIDSQPARIVDELSTTVGKPVSKTPLSDALRQQDSVTQAAKVTPEPSARYTEPLDGGKRTQDGLKERGFSENIRTDRAIAPEANASFDKDGEFYQELANATTLEKAQARFDRGYEEALRDFDLTKTKFTPDNVVLSKLLANEAAVRGDLITMRRVLSDTAETLTQAGQYSQAARILRESNDPATVLQYLQREIKKLNDQGLKRYGTLKNKLIGKGQKGWKNIELNEDELAKVAKFTADTTDQEKQLLFEELYESISKRIPTSNREKFDAWRRIAMLTNPKTHARNIIGNGIMAGVKKVSDAGGEALEKAFVPKLQRTKSLYKSNAKRQIAEEYWKNNAKELSDGSRWEIFGVKSPFTEKKIFNTKALEAINEFSKNTLEAEDIFFLKRHFTGDLAGFMQARGLKEPTQEAVDYALRRAQEATFRQQNALADIIATGKKSRYGLLVEAAVPFSKTPANIAQMGIDYSPIGVVKSIGQLATNKPPAEFIETLSKGLTGTGIAAVGAYMAYNGMARGEYRTDPEEEALLNRAGILPNSVQLKNGSYTIDWAQPAAIPYFMGVAFAEEMKKKDDKDLASKALTGLTKGTSTIFKQTMLKGITDLFGSYDAEGIVENIAELPFNYATQAVPTLGGQIARSVDPVKRERDYSGILPSLESQVKSKIPGVSLSLPSKRGLFGEEIKYGEGTLNTVQQFLSPGYYAKKQDDPLTNELLRLYNEIGSSFLPRAKVKSLSNKGEKYTLTPQEKSDFQKVMGEYTEQNLIKLFNSVNYQSMDDESKAKAIKSVNDDGYDLAKAKFLEGKE